MLTLLLLACNCPHPEPLVGGCVLLDSFASDGDTGASVGADTAAADTGSDQPDVSVTTIRATVASITQLDPAESPGMGVDASGAVISPRGVHAGYNGPWTHLALDIDDGSSGDAWFIAGAPGLVAAGEVVDIAVTEAFGGSQFAISGANGGRLWVGESRQWDGAATALADGDVTFAEGQEACADQDRCQTTRYHDIDITDPDGTFTLPTGGTVTRGASVYIHGGATTYDHVSTAWTCGEPWGLQDQLAVASVSASAFDSAALWP